MAAEKVHVLWSPNTPEEFATYSSQLKIYSIKKKDEQLEDTKSLAEGLNLSDKSYGELLTSAPEAQCNPLHKTVAWQQNKVNTRCFAVGESNGRVTLISISNPNNPSTGSRLYQLSTKTLGRTCYTVSWNPDNIKLLAQGLDKTRADSSLIVWDVTRASLMTPNFSSTVDNSARIKMGPVSLLGKPDSHGTDESGKLFETGNSETTHSISWIPGQSSCMVAGMGTTYLKIFDIRDSSKDPKAYVQNKAVYGLAVDWSNPHQIASFAKSNTVFMWDTRNFKSPVYSFQRPGNVVQLEWIPTRPGCLSVLLSEPPFLRLINIPSLTQEGIRKMCACVEWHPKWVNKGLYVTNEGAVKELDIFDKIPVTWSSCDPLVYVINGEMYSQNVNDCSPAPEDISHSMLKRIKQGYGFDVSTNVKILKEGSSLQQVWSWIHEQISSPNFDQTKKVGGVNAVLESILSREVTLSPPQGETLSYPTYSSPERIAALKLCGWSFVTDNNLEGFIKREEMNERYERAAAIAVFQGDIKLAISSLREGASTTNRKIDRSSNDLNLIALSLAGFSASEPSLWQETCTSIKKQIAHPYLRAIFSFLCANCAPEGFRAVLNDYEVTLQDRVALACIYLNNKKLKDFLASETSNVTTKGRIEGLFLTGLQESGINLLENYVNKVFNIIGDVQTACLIAGQSFTGVPKGNQLVPMWFTGYRELLDQWQLWKERAMLDHERKLRDPAHKSPRQSAILCTFCSKAISSDSLRQDLANKSKKSTSCPSCRKPLPRCSLCLLHMVAGVSKGKEHGSPINQSDQFGQWFTWCQTCRHGGHASHMMDWFKSHEVCPVTDCTCHCMSLDCLS